MGILITWGAFYRGTAFLEGGQVPWEHPHYMGGAIPWRRGFRFPGHLLSLEGTQSLWGHFHSMKPISWWGGVIFLGDFPYLGRRGVISGSLGRVLMFPWGHFLPFGDDHFLGGPYIPLVSQTAS